MSPGDARIVVASRDAEKGEKAIGEIAEQAGCDAGNVAYIQTDICSEADNIAMVKYAVDTFGRLDGAINNAVFPGDFQLLADEPVETFEQVMRTNVTGTFLGMQAVTPHMKRERRGVIINTSSVSGITPNNATGAYGASKFAVRGLTRSAALELGPHGIRVNSVHPGGVNTPMTNPLGQSNDEVNERYGFVPIQRGSEPHEIANGVLYLASDAASYCNGTELVIDGGMIAGQYLPGMPGSPI